MTRSAPTRCANADCGGSASAATPETIPRSASEAHGPKSGKHQRHDQTGDWEAHTDSPRDDARRRAPQPSACPEQYGCAQRTGQPHVCTTVSPQDAGSSTCDGSRGSIGSGIGGRERRASTSRPSCLSIIIVRDSLDRNVAGRTPTRGRVQCSAFGNRRAAPTWVARVCVAGPDGAHDCPHLSSRAGSPRLPMTPRR